MKTLILFSLAGLCACSTVSRTDQDMIRKIYDEQLTGSPVYDNLRYLTKEIGHRNAGSEELNEAIRYTSDLMRSYGFDTVFQQPVMVSNWKRGPKEIVRIVGEPGQEDRELHALALGNSIGTGDKGITGEVIEIDGMDKLEETSMDLIEGKIVFLNEPMDPTLINTFRAYGNAVGQRGEGAAKSSEKGAIAVLVRSVGTSKDTVPHTGWMGYEKGVKKIPALAISTLDADLLSEMLARQTGLKVYIEAHCRTEPMAQSYNVVGEVKGDRHPEEIIAVGGHIDSWDVGEGAHDDGGGCLQAIEVLRTFKSLGIKPDHTLRAVMWVDEENGGYGHDEYYKQTTEKGEKHIAAIESDAGSFTPLGFAYQTNNRKATKTLLSWQPYFKPFQVTNFVQGYSGTDIHQLLDDKILLLGLLPDSQRYFTLHHSGKDVFEAVDPRELELCAAAMTSMVYMIDRHASEYYRP